MYTGEHFETLVALGIRDMVTLQEVSQLPVLQTAIAELPKTVQDKVNVLQSLLTSSKMRERMEDLTAFINIVEDKDQGGVNRASSELAGGDQ